MSFHLPRIGPALCALSAGILTLTDESSAQVMPQRNSQALSAAMAEAGRSPFHARDPVNRSMNVRPAPGGDPASLFGEGTQTRGRFNETVEDPRAASDRAPGTASLVWSTALGTVAGDFLTSRVFPDDDDPLFRVLIRHGILSVPLAALAATTLGGAHPGWALLGSSLGFPTGVGAGFLVAYALEDALGYGALLPALATYYGVRVAVAVATVKLAGTRAGPIGR